MSTEEIETATHQQTGELTNEQEEVEELPTHPEGLDYTMGGPTSVDPPQDPDSPLSPAYDIPIPRGSQKVKIQAADMWDGNTYTLNSVNVPVEIAHQRRNRMSVRVSLRAGVSVTLSPSQSGASNGVQLNADNPHIDIAATAPIWALPAAAGVVVDVIEEYYTE